MFQIKFYTDEHEFEWDDFVLNKSVNGTFLHTRSFLNYHPKDRFQDCSLLIFNKKNNLAAVVPACRDPKNYNSFFSHKGSTYGGIIIDKKHYNSYNLLPIIDIIESFLQQNNFKSIYLKITPDILCVDPPALLEYSLYYKEYAQCSELNTYIDISKYDENILTNFSQGKRTNINNCLKENLVYKRINTSEEIKKLYCILSENLKKYNATPVHTYSELLSLKDVYIKKNIIFFACYKENEIIAGAIVFQFRDTLHTQYLCAKEKYAKLSPMSFMYYSMIEYTKKMGINKISWGISTENSGKILNLGLLKNKESYGSTYSLNKTFYKNI